MAEFLKEPLNACQHDNTRENKTFQKRKILILFELPCKDRNAGSIGI